jgi:lipopolysaccharide export system permease protein
MSLIANLLTRMIMIRFAVILLGLSAFVLTLEAVSYLNDILKLSSNPLIAMLLYGVMRLPATFSLFLPTSLLLALLLTTTELSYRNELTAIWATGISPTRLIRMLIPLALVVGGINFLIADQAVPAAAPFLRSWGIGDYATRKFTTNPDDPVWMRSGDDIMRADRVTDNGDALESLIVFRREKTGELREQVFADSAVQNDGRWLLKNVTIYYANGEKPTHLDQMIYDGALQLASNKVAGPEEMTTQELSRFIANKGFGVRPQYVYETWWYKRLTPPVVALVMIMLCVPLGTYFRRGGGLGGIFVAGVLMGFVYFVGDGVAMTLGETGRVAPWLAAWGPILLFAALGFALLSRTDHV